MKNLILFLFLFISTGIQAQKMIHELPAKTNVDSTNWLFLAGNPTSGKLYKITAANLRDSVYPATDTTSLSNRINLKLNATDTASLSTRINLKLNATDTASLSTRIDGKQATLVSGTNLKTVNGSTLLGSGDLVIAGGGSADGDSSWYIVTDYGADKTGVADATAEIQAAIDAAEITGGIVYIPRGTYKVTDTLFIRANNVVIMGEGESSKILASGDYGNIFDVEPATAPTDQYTGINGIQFIKFYIESETARTSGAAIHVQYSYNFIAQDMRIGTLDFAGDNSVPMNIYNGIYLEHQSAAVISGCQIYPTHYGVYFSGSRVGDGAVGNFYWDGLITGNCNIWGKRNNGAWVTGSAGVYIGGGTGGVQIEQSAISFFDNGIRAVGVNRELFLGHAFSADDCGGAGIYITGTLDILQITGGWSAGCGRGSQTPSHAIYLDSAVVNSVGGSPNINITGGTFYASENGIYIGAGEVSITGMTTYLNSLSNLTLGPNVTSATITGGRIPSLVNNSAITPKINGVTGLADITELSSISLQSVVSTEQGLSIIDATDTKLSFIGSTDAASTSYLFLRTNRGYDGAINTTSGYYGTRTGASLQLENDELAFYQFPSSSGTGTQVFRINSGGGIDAGNITLSQGLNLSGPIINTTHDEDSYQERVGTFLLQSYSLNNGFLSDNAYFNGSSWTRLNTGYATGFQFTGGSLLVHSINTGTGNFTQQVQLKSDYSGKFGLGVNVSVGDFTGATLFHDAAANTTVLGTGASGATQASSLLTLTSTTKGFLPPRMTAAQAGAISSPAEGLLVYVTDTDGTFTAKGWWGFDGSAWAKLNN